MTWWLLGYHDLQKCSIARKALAYNLEQHVTFEK